MKKMLFTLVLFVLLTPYAVSAKKKDMLGPGEWPTTVDGTVKDILSSMSKKDKDTVRQVKNSDLIRYHHGWGTGIRNYYGLWRGNKELLISACGQPCHPDDASMIIIEKVWEALQPKKP